MGYSANKTAAAVASSLLHCGAHHSHYGPCQLPPVEGVALQRSVGHATSPAMSNPCRPAACQPPHGDLSLSAPPPCCDAGARHLHCGLPASSPRRGTVLSQRGRPASSPSVVYSTPGSSWMRRSAALASRSSLFCVRNAWCQTARSSFRHRGQIAPANGGRFLWPCTALLGTLQPKPSG